MKPLRLLALISFCCLIPAARAGTWQAALEGGAVWFSRNDVRIPGDTGTRFDLLDLTGAGPDAVGRVEATYAFNPRHALRLTLAPLSTGGTGTLDQDVAFAGADFPAGIPTKASYQFKTYRLTYRWTFHESRRWRWGLGAAVLVRDAEISLRQADRHASKDDLGVVPLLHLRSEYFLTEHASLLADLEGLGSPQGRALDATLQCRWEFPAGWQVTAGYRTIEGGADNDEVYTFAWLHQAIAAIGRRF